MLKKLTLKNYGPHKNTEIIFNEDSTIISGDNGSGKTFIINALETMLLNKSIRPEDVRHGEKSSCIVLETSDYILQKSYANKVHKTMLITRDGTQEFTGVKGFDEYILPITKCGTSVVGKVAIDNTFVKVSDQILPYIHSPKDLLVAVVGAYASVDFKAISTKFDTELRRLSQVISTRRNNIEVVDKYINLAKELEDTLEAIDGEIRNVTKKIHEAQNVLLSKRTSDLTTRASAIDKELNDVNNQIAEVNKRLTMLRTKVCPTCNKPL
jgi:DNA repair exonuclease SbcCD ATPase subunit